MKFLLLVPLLISLTGCMSAQTKADIERYAREAAGLEVRVTQLRLEDPGSKMLPILEAQWAAAERALAAAQEKGEQEIKDQIADIAEKTESGIEHVGKPVAGALFPPALIILNILGALAGLAKGIGNRKE